MFNLNFVQLLLFPAVFLFVVLSSEFHIANARYCEIYTHILCTAPAVRIKLVRDRKNLLWPDGVVGWCDGAG